MHYIYQTLPSPRAILKAICAGVGWEEALPSDKWGYVTDYNCWLSQREMSVFATQIEQPKQHVARKNEGRGNTMILMLSMAHLTRNVA